MYTHTTQIRLHDTDAAGFLFFANQFKIIHDAYEHLAESLGFGFSQVLKGRKYLFPIVHAESDYKAPLYTGDKITVTISIEHIGKTSFSFHYTILDRNNTLVGTAKTVHVAIIAKTHIKTPLPIKLRKALEAFSKKSNATRHVTPKSR